MNVCLVPGSYDPITRGHADTIRRASRLFDEVVVAILRNPDKRGWLDWDRREALARAALDGIPGVKVTQFEGLAVDCARKYGAKAIVRGLRSALDFEYESVMADANRELSSYRGGGDAVETVFLAAEPSLAHWSSSVARQLAAFDGPLELIVPDGSVMLLKRFISDMRGTAGGDN
ncbi:MAG: pantetheine-phosphate adenylyltransferase [Oscillospiraceae bacterium]|jgi:pantetheine-phosphate adenylyltransferase|nr:pantetheine-phosphate adenylyltransferase [Oscillospiraceae bacterium]